MAYKWEIKEKLFDEMVKSKNKKVFKSPVFEIDGFKWQIEICPNGYTSQQIGSFQVYVKLVTLRTGQKRIIVRRTIKCPQTQSGITVLASYDRSGHSRGWATNTLRLRDVIDTQSLTKQNITIIVATKILQIIGKQNNVLYSAKLPQNYQKSEFEWKMSPKTLSIAQKAYNGKCIVSDIFNGMWAIKIVPNGRTMKESGECMVALQLCSNVFNEYMIEIETKITIEQLHFNGAKSFKYECLLGSKWMNIGSFEQLQKCKDLVIRAQIWITKTHSPHSILQLSHKIAQRPAWQDLNSRGILLDDPSTNQSQSLHAAHRQMQKRRASHNLDKMLMNRPTPDDLHRQNIIDARTAALFFGASPATEVVTETVSRGILIKNETEQRKHKRKASQELEAVWLGADLKNRERLSELQGLGYDRKFDQNTNFGTKEIQTPNSEMKYEKENAKPLSVNLNRVNVEEREYEFDANKTGEMMFERLIDTDKYESEIYRLNTELKSAEREIEELKEKLKGVSDNKTVKKDSDSAMKWFINVLYG